MKAKLKNGMEVEGTPEEFNHLYLGEVALPIKVELLSKKRGKRGTYKKRRKHRHKGSLKTLQRRLPPDYANHRTWTAEDDQFVLDNYPKGGRGIRYDKEYLKEIERMCHSLGRTARALQQRMFYLRALNRARKE